jgi:hypothetical protein
MCDDADLEAAACEQIEAGEAHGEDGGEEEGGEEERVRLEPLGRGHKTQT